jgi:hypothetical protein
MTHTLHRKGTRESLNRDYVFLCMAAKNINEDGSDEKMREFLRIVLKHKAINYGDMRTGNSFYCTPDEIIEKVSSTSIVHGVFTDKDTVTKVMKNLKKANLGMSVVVSGPFASIEEACQEAGVKPHSIDYSGGIWGKTEKLARPEVLEVTTMCGHAMISANLVEEIAKRINAGVITAKEGALELGRVCCCGIYNQDRAKKLLKKLVN